MINSNTWLKIYYTLSISSIIKRIQATILILAVSLVQACAGYIEYGKDYNTVDHFDGLYEDTKNTSYDKKTYYYDAKINKQDVLNSWGKPYTIEIQGSRGETREIWKYHRGIEMRGFAPILIIPVPLPLFWWPEGWDTTTVKFDGDIVVSASSSDYSFNDGYVCLLVFCGDYPMNDLH